MKDVFSFVGGALLGAAIGAGIIMLSTPKSGEEARESLRERWNDALELGKRVAREREQELWADFNTRVKAPAGLPLDDRDKLEPTVV
ncbi:MAG TPA: YtxH domain-containing protein [Herpetosiphonaceae bacterium]